MPAQSVAEFFDRLNGDYTATIERCFPRYREMLCSLIDYLCLSSAPQAILEIGSGTGNLSVLLAQQFPQAELHLLDVSAESLQVCRQRLQSHPTAHSQLEDIRQAAFAPQSFDLIVSSITIHHLTAEEKQRLLGSCLDWLRPAGTLAVADQFRGATAAVYAQHIDNWKQMSFAAGATPAEFEMWMEHQREHDHHDTLLDHLHWLTQAGFAPVDCVWRCLLWGVVVAYKP